jgi:hypothetical protein
VERQVNRLRAEPEFAGAGRDAFSALAKDSLSKAQHAAGNALARAQAAGDGEALRSILDAKIEQLEGMERAEREARATAERTEAAIRDVTSRITTVCLSLGLTSQGRTAFAATVASAVEEEEISTVALREAEAKLSSVAGSVQGAAEKLKELEYLRGQLEAEVQARQAEAALILDTWRHSGLPEPIGTDALKNTIEWAEKHLADLTAMKVRHEGLVAGLAAWASADELKRSEEGIANSLALSGCTREEAIVEVLMVDIRV